MPPEEDREPAMVLWLAYIPCYKARSLTVPAGAITSEVDLYLSLPVFYKPSRLPDRSPIVAAHMRGTYASSSAPEEHGIKCSKVSL